MRYNLLCSTFIFILYKFLTSGIIAIWFKSHGSSELKGFKGIIKFDGKKSRYWKIQVKDFLTCKKMHKAFTERPKVMSGEGRKPWIKN